MDRLGRQRLGLSFFSSSHPYAGKRTEHSGCGNEVLPGRLTHVPPLPSPLSAGLSSGAAGAVICRGQGARRKGTGLKGMSKSQVWDVEKQMLKCGCGR